MFLCFRFFLNLISAESDLVTFVQIKSHYKTDYEIGTKLFTVETRSATLAEMYDMAAKTPVPAIDEMDRIMGHRDRRSSDAFVCTPIMGQTRRRMNKNIDIDIETRMVSLYCFLCLLSLFLIKKSDHQLNFYY